MKGGTGDEISIARHREVEQCSIGSIAFYLFGQEILGHQSLVPPINEFIPGSSPVLYRQSYDVALFQSRKRNVKRKKTSAGVMDLDGHGIQLERGLTYEGKIF